MKSMILLAMAGCLALCFAGCDKPAAPAPAAPAAAEAPATVAQPEVPRFEPQYAVAIEESKTDPKQYAVTWSARVNTGGWAMKTDSVLVEEYNGMMACRIWVTLEQPNPSATVTQGFETVAGKHDAGTTKIERVEFSVRRNVQGVKYDFPATYSVVKSIKYPY